MSKFISIGSVSVALNDLKSLSNDAKIQIMKEMFQNTGLETDNNGQIVLYTDLMYADNDRRSIVPLVVEPANGFDSDAPDPFEEEEQEDSSPQGAFEGRLNYVHSAHDDLPPTLRESELAPPTEQN